MKALALRDYQQDALDAVIASIRTDGGALQRPAVVLPTGTGKTVIFVHLIDRLVSTGGRVLVLVDRDELVNQTLAQLRDACPDLEPTVVKAERNDWTGTVVIGSVQTLRRTSRLEQIPADAFSTTIVDECDLAAADGYRRILTYFGCYAPQEGPAGPFTSAAIGFTATMSREDKRGLGDVWQDVVYSRDILDMIKLGHLVDPIGYQVTVDGLDLATVARSGGDYQDGSLGDAMVASGAGPVIAASFREHATRPDGCLRRGIGFAPTIAAAQAFHQAFVDAGIPSELVIGSTSSEDRALIYKRTRSGDNIFIWSVGVLTRGFDIPEIEVCVIARPTTSRALYVQMVGRVLRLAPWIGKTNAYVLDVCGVSAVMPLRGMIDLSETVIPQPRPGESLIEAKIRGEIEAGRKPSKELIGLVSKEQVDLFHRAATVWLQTYCGVWFIPAGKTTFFLWPCADGIHYRVGRADSYGRNGAWMDGEHEMDSARSWAEQYASEADSSLSSKRASWRRRKEPVTDAQAGILVKAGLELPETKREASNMISILFTSRWLDRTLRK